MEIEIPKANIQSRQYVVVFRASSAAMFAQGSLLRINVLSPYGIVVLTFRTRFVDKGLEHPLPGDLWVDARGPAPSLESAVSQFGHAAASITPIIGISTNSAIDVLNPELIFDNTPGIETREYLQSMIPEERPILHEGRLVPIDPTKALIRAIEEHEEKERITRSISQYHFALRYWRMGFETLSTAHLFMGMEALTKAVTRVKLKASGLSEANFARTLGIEPTKLGRCDRLSSAIEAAVRRQYLFQNDSETHRAAKQASDGFEHGFMPFEEIREHAQKVREKTAHYLRVALFKLININQLQYEALMISPRDVPLGNWPIVKYIRGNLSGSNQQLAAEGNEYPIMTWRTSIKSVDFNEKGEYHLYFDEKWTPRLGEGIVFKPQSFEMWSP